MSPGRSLSHELRASLRWDRCAVGESASTKKKSGRIVTGVRGLVANTEHAPPVSTLGMLGNPQISRSHKIGKAMRRGCVVAVAIFLAIDLCAGDPWKQKSYKVWDQNDVRKILNESPC